MSSAEVFTPRGFVITTDVVDDLRLRLGCGALCYIANNVYRDKLSELDYHTLTATDNRYITIHPVPL